MLSKEDLISKYDDYSDDELFEVYSNIDTYSADAKEALNIVLTKKGGLENLIKRQNEKKIISNEVERINYEVTKLNNPEIDIKFLEKMITSNILSQEKINEIIDIKYSALKLEQEDKKIKPRTIFGSLIGSIIASIVGGILWGLQLIYSSRVFIILLVGLALLCYGIIRLLTKQSKKNLVVLIATVISIILAVLIGQLLYEIIGYRG